MKSEPTEIASNTNVRAIEVDPTGVGDKAEVTAMLYGTASGAGT